MEGVSFLVDFSTKREMSDANITILLLLGFIIDDYCRRKYNGTD